jgi:glycine/sarcosine N-methyltransferase
MSFYRSIAPYYDYIFPPSPLQVQFIESIAGKLERKKMLEVGGGTGNLAMLLGEQGALVDGIDLDEEMVAYAREKAHGNEDVNFYGMDMLQISEKWKGNTFDTVVCFGNTIVHLDDLPQIKSFFSMAKHVIKHDGYLLVQIINYDRILNQQIAGLPTIENEEIKFQRFYDIHENMEKIDFRTQLKVKATGEEICNVVQLFPLRKRQIESLLEECGFEEIRFYGSFSGQPLSEDSVPLIFSARKSSC